MLTDDLLALQQLDTTIDQLTYRRTQLPERAAAATTAEEVRRDERRMKVLAARDGELEQAVAQLERDGEVLTAQRQRLNAQLRTVIAPREAEALMHELEVIASRRNELDDHELAHLEEQAELATERDGLDGGRPALTARAASAAAELAAAQAAIDEELAGASSSRAALAARLDPAMLSRYERLRTRFGGVAVARLEGRRCAGCHLDLSLGEIGELRSVPDGEFAECPECGRLLVA